MAGAEAKAKAAPAPKPAAAPVHANTNASSASPAKPPAPAAKPAAPAAASAAASPAKSSAAAKPPVSKPASAAPTPAAAKAPPKVEAPATARGRPLSRAARASAENSTSPHGGSHSPVLSPAKSILYGEVRDRHGEHHGRDKSEGHLRQENRELREMLIQNGLFIRVAQGLTKLGLEPPADMRDLTMAMSAEKYRATLVSQMPQAQKLSELWEERAHRVSDQERLAMACLDELRAACKEMYKSITRHHLVASDDAITCVQTAAQAASRAVRLANKAAVEQYPLDFLARFLAFQQALEEVHEVSKRSTEALEVVTGRRALDAAVKDDIAAVRAAAARSGLPDTPLARTLELLGKLVDRLCIQSATKHKESDDTIDDSALMGIRVTGAIQLHGLSQTKTELNACEQQAAAADAAAATETPADAMRGARLVHALLSQMVPLASGRVSEADAISRVTAAAAAPAKRKAVVVGIDYTAASDASVKLTGAIKDAHTVQALLTDRLGFMADDVRVLTDDSDAATPPPTAAQLRKALRWLTAGAAPGDHLAFYFAGLATLVPDVDGDGAGGRDQCLCPLDMLTVSQDKCISDEELRATLFNVPEGVRVTAVFDCTHGGTVADLSAVKIVEPAGGFPATASAAKPASMLKPSISKSAAVAAKADASAPGASNKARFWYRAGVADLQTPTDEDPATATAAAAVRSAAVAAVGSGGAVVITACNDAQNALEMEAEGAGGGGGGAATAALVAALGQEFDGGLPPPVTQLVEKMNIWLEEKGIEQTVQLRVVGKAFDGGDCRFLQ